MSWYAGLILKEKPEKQIFWESLTCLSWSLSYQNRNSEDTELGLVVNVYINFYTLKILYFVFKRQQTSYKDLGHKQNFN